MKDRGKEDIIIIGSVGTALNVIEQILDAKINHFVNINLKGIIIDSFEIGSIICGVPVVGRNQDISNFLKESRIKFLFALFKPDKMKERYELMKSLQIPLERYANFIHPLSYSAGSIKMGKGNVVLSNTTLQSNVTLGDFNIINSNVTIEHDTIVGDGNFFAANSCIGSRVKIGNYCFIGLNSSIRENVNLEENVFVGMHSLVLNDFSRCTVAGVPAKWIKDN